MKTKNRKVTIKATGPQGSGKTTVLKKIKRILEAHDVKGIVLNIEQDRLDFDPLSEQIVKDLLW